MQHDHRTPDFDERPLFCARCGGELSKERDDTNGYPCLRCERRTWVDPKVAACAAFHWDGRIVLVRRGIEPRYGFWVLPGGYCDRGEHPARAAERETLEETGLEVRTTGLLGAYAYDGSPVIVLNYECEVLGGGPPRPLDEALEIGLFTPETIPWEELAFPSNRDGLRDFVAHRNAVRHA